MPCPTNILAKIGPKRYVWTIDLSRAYYQLPASPQHRNCLAFKTPTLGLMRYAKLPIGLKTSGKPSAFTL